MYIYILDYCDCSINEIELDVEDIDNDDIERILKDYGIDIDGCDYMYSENQLKIKRCNKLKKD